MKLTVARSISLSLLLTAAGAFAGCASASGDDPSNDESLQLSEAALSSNEHTAYNYFVAKGLSKIQSAGIVGNLIQESSVNPASVEFGGGPGRGIAQWSVGGRWDTSKNDNVAWYASSHSGNKATLTTQLDFIWYELNTFSGYGLASLKASTTITSAVTAFQNKYEICGTCDATNRINYANEVLAAYGGGSTGGGADCFSSTLDKDMPENACVQSKADSLWYQCDNGEWVDRFTDPTACNGVYPL